MCTKQFVEAGLLPTNMEDLSDFAKAIASLLTEPTVNKETNSEEEELEDVDIME